MYDENNDTLCLFLCKQCLNIPYIKFCYHKGEPGIKIKCKCTNYRYIIKSLSEFISEYKAEIYLNDEIFNELNYLKQFKCYQHVTERIYAYCEECKETVCYQCFLKHSQSDQRKPKKISSYNINVEEVQGKLEQLKSKFPLEDSNVIILIEVIINSFVYYKSKDSLNHVVISNFINNTILNECYTTHHRNIIRTSYIDCLYTINDHKNKVMSLLSMNGILISSSLDRTIKVFKENEDSKKLYTNLCTFKIKGKFSQSLLQLTEDTFISFCENGYVNIYSISLMKCIQEKQCDFGQFLDVKFYSNKTKFIVSSYDYTIQIWSLQTLQCESKLIVNETDYIRAILITKDNRIISCGEDDVVSFFSIPQLRLTQRIKEIECSSSKALIQLSQNAIAIGGDAIITILNILNYQTLMKIVWDYGRIISLMKINDDILLCGFDYFEMKQIDICKRKVYDITEGHDDKVTCIAVMANEKIATASHDSKIKIWT